MRKKIGFRKQASFFGLERYVTGEMVVISDNPANVSGCLALDDCEPALMAPPGMDDGHDIAKTCTSRYLEFPFLRHEGGAGKDTGRVIVEQFADHATAFQCPADRGMAVTRGDTNQDGLLMRPFGADNQHFQSEPGTDDGGNKKSEKGHRPEQKPGGRPHDQVT